MIFRRRREQVPPTDGGARAVRAARDYRTVAGPGPVAFGYKIAWLAIRTDEMAEAAKALGLIEGRDAPWAAGIDAVYQARGGLRVFLTPAVDGWTLAVLGGDLIEDEGTGADVLDLASLSRRCGEAQKFATHRVVEYHEWQRWVDGLPVRRYCYVGESGEIRFDEGEPARAEGNLLRLADLDGDWDAIDLADEETVMAVATEWSINPTTLKGCEDLPPQGILGLLS